VLINASAMAWVLRKHLPAAIAANAAATEEAVPWLVSLVHLAFLAGVVVLAHHPVLFLGLFLFFLGYTEAYARFQSPLILKEGLLVGFFLAGLVVLGGMQQMVAAAHRVQPRTHRTFLRRTGTDCGHR